MTWIIIAVAVLAVLFFLMSGMKQSAAPAALPSSGKPTTEDSRRRLEAEFSRNKIRLQAMPDDEAKALMGALREDATTHWNHAFNTATGDGKDPKFATQLALFRTAAVILTGEQQPDMLYYGGLDLETVPFSQIQPNPSGLECPDPCAPPVRRQGLRRQQVAIES